MDKDLAAFASLVDHGTGASKGEDISATMQALDNRANAVAKMVFGPLWKTETYDHRAVSDSIAVDVFCSKMDKDPDKGLYWIEAWEFPRLILKFQSKTGLVMSNLEIRNLKSLSLGFYIPVNKARKTYG